MAWTAEPCATIYNVYQVTAQRLVDTDLDGLADDYGSCFLPDLPSPQMTDMGDPPVGFVVAAADQAAVPFFDLYESP